MAKSDFKYPGWRASLLAMSIGFLIVFPFRADAQSTFPQARTFSQQGGEAIFMGLCRDCHMANARGAVGAGAYPSLASNPKLAVAGYPISVVTNGQKAMPAFGPMLNDRQIADVVNYIRTHFGNSFADKAGPADVKSIRPE